MQHEMHVLGIDIAKRVFHLVGRDDRGKIVSLNLSHFVARQIWWRCGVSPLCGRAHRQQRRKPLRGPLVPMDTTCDLLQTAINWANCSYWWVARSPHTALTGSLYENTVVPT